MADITITDSQKATLGIAGYKDKKGNPTPAVPGVSLTWLTSNSDVLALTPATDGSCEVAAVGPLTTPDAPAVVSLTVKDASGAVLASGAERVFVISGAPVTVEISSSTPVEQS